MLDDRKNIDQHKKDGNKVLIKLSGVNIAFSQKGLATVSQAPVVLIESLKLE